MPAVERHLAAAEHRHFGGMLPRRLIGVGGPAPARSAPRRRRTLEKSVPTGFAVAIDQPVDSAIQPTMAIHIGAEQDQAVAARPFGGQPSAGLQALPDMSHFATEFYECCASLGGFA